MHFIPFRALKFGAERLNEAPVSYSKSRVSGSLQMSYIMCDKAGCMPGQPDLFQIKKTSIPALNAPIKRNQINSSFVRDSRLLMRQPFGPQYTNQAPRNNFTFDKHCPNDDENFEIAVKAAYRQIYGNFHLMDSERPRDLERKLRNGDICIREFIRGLSKTYFYKHHYFELVNQQRSIELNFKHFLGRPPTNQAEIIFHVRIMNNYGYNSHIDQLIDSQEYEQIFGPNIVPYARCWDSQCGLRTSHFVLMASLSKRFAYSDNTMHMGSSKTEGRSLV